MTTKDFRQFSETKLLYEHGFNVIDATIVKDSNQYIMFMKDESNKPFTPQKNIRMASADKAVGPYSLPSEPVTGDYWAEGPSAIKFHNRWYLYFDKYRLRKYGLLVSTDLATWQDWSDSLIFPEGARHGTVFRVEPDILKRLLVVQKPQEVETK